MLSDRIPRKTARLLGETVHPARVILFGSYARGDTADVSDADFLVTESEVCNLGAEMVRLSHLVQFLRIEADVQGCSRSEVEKWQVWCSDAAYWTMREGEVLYAST